MPDGVVILGDHSITVDDVAAIARGRRPAALSRGARGAWPRSAPWSSAMWRRTCRSTASPPALGARGRHPRPRRRRPRRLPAPRPLRPRRRRRRGHAGRGCARHDGRPAPPAWRSARSGVSPAVAEALVAALNAGFHPVVPSIGSIGAADLAPLAHMAVALLGEGEAEFGGARLPGADALARAGLAPLALGVKDGHALVVANAASAGRGALALVDARLALDTLDAAAALAMEAFGANLAAAAGGERRAAGAGQAAAARRLLGLVAGGHLGDRGPARRRRTRSPSAAPRRCTGRHATALAEAAAAVELELNHSGDNPVVIDGQMLSNGNFDMTGLTLRFEALAQALSHAATISAQRALKLMSPGYSDQPALPPPLGPSRAGFAPLQKVIGALEGEIRARAQPATLALLHVADGVEDHAANAPAAVTKLRESAARLVVLAACAS